MTGYAISKKQKIILAISNNFAKSSLIRPKYGGLSCRLAPRVTGQDSVGNGSEADEHNRLADNV
jgi:hypothetical protein